MVSDLFSTIATEAYAVLTHVLPAALQWTWRKYIVQDLTTFPLEATTAKVAYLNLHGSLPETPQPVTPVLLVHGDYGHPYSLLPLANLAEDNRLPTFSLYIPGIHDNTDFETNIYLLQSAIDKIEALMEGRCEGILGVGHSKGAILLAKRQFVDLDPRLKATCAISGRLNAPRDDSCPDKTLESIVRNIYTSICANPQLPLSQIIPQLDWNASQDSMAVRPYDHCFSVPGMHLSGLYTQETYDTVSRFYEEYAEGLIPRLSTVFSRSTP